MIDLIYFPLVRGPMGAGLGKMAGWNITSYFGTRPNPFTGAISRHGGMDFAYPNCTGALIVAPHNATMSQSWDYSGGGAPGTKTGGGYWTGLTFDDGSYMGIGHAAKFAPGPSYRRVVAGEILAYVGTSGASTGPHAHIAYRMPGQSVYSDGYDILKAASNRCINDTPPISSIIPPTDPGTPIPPIETEDENMAAVRFVFPEGTEYVLAVESESPTGLEWTHVVNPTTKVDGVLNGLYSTRAVLLADGNDAADAMFERHPVASGPHKRDTYNPA